MVFRGPVADLLQGHQTEGGGRAGQDTARSHQNGLTVEALDAPGSPPATSSLAQIDPAGCHSFGLWVIQHL
ncbi:hypothetical protein [Nonomuraea rosea]|uniref:hypothetical protein n=1 Tax=Nonomuraea rosea TaxID=638574 RepID=UPI0031E5EAD6